MNAQRQLEPRVQYSPRPTSSSLTNHNMSGCVIKVASLDWPSHQHHDKLTVECAGEAFVDLCLRQKARRVLHHGSSFFGCESGELLVEDEESAAKQKKSINLLLLSHRKLEKLTYYQCLGDLPLHSTAEQIKRAYHKACLKYHPDKTGRGEDDEVFLKVKAAFDTLSDPYKKKAYDSTMDFDDSIPKGGESPQDFFAIYGPVFERNLRFDSRLDPTKQQPTPAENATANGTPSGKKKKNKKGGAKNNASANAKPKEFPTLGDDDTPIATVHAFYEYWIHFESWRDFSLEAAKQTGDHYDPDSADSRYEKRFMQKEIEKKSKSLKKEEMTRLNLLVERAMANDPRLRREKQKERDDKEKLAQQKRDAEEQAAKAASEAALRSAEEAARQEQEEKVQKANAKQQKETEKKILRKAKQTFRKLAMAAWQMASATGSTSTTTTMDMMNDQVEFLCDNLIAAELDDLSDTFGGIDSVDAPNVAALKRLNERVADVKEGRLEEQRKEAAKRKEELAKKSVAKPISTMVPWSKEELTALTKAVKKFPPGGANRWDAIASMINTLCKPDNPRTKEDCIHTYNKIVSLSGAPVLTSSNGNGAPALVDEVVWTEGQDKALQDALKKYPATMEKNDRWAAIAKDVEGKTKKDCVNRFKAIRDALQSKKPNEVQQ